MAALSEVRQVAVTSDFEVPSPTRRTGSKLNSAGWFSDSESKQRYVSWSGFAIGAAESTKMPHAGLEVALAPSIKTEVEAAYARSGLFGRSQRQINDPDSLSAPSLVAARRSDGFARAAWGKSRWSRILACGRHCVPAGRPAVKPNRPSPEGGTAVRGSGKLGIEPACPLRTLGPGC